jgi:hypothetical protein
MSARAHHALLMASAAVAYVDDYVTPYGVWSAEKKLIRAYSGPAIRVRRSSDNTEQDINFAGDLLDTAALLAFTGSNSGYVTKIYQQVAALTGADLVQATAGSQPRIVNAGTLEADYAWHDGTDDYLRATLPAGGLASAQATVFARMRIDNVVTSAGTNVGGVIDAGYNKAGVNGFLLYADVSGVTGVNGLGGGMSSGAGSYETRGMPDSARGVFGAVHTFCARYDLATNFTDARAIDLYQDGSNASVSTLNAANPSGLFNNTALFTGRYDNFTWYTRVGLHSVVVVAADVLAPRANIEELL